MPRWPRVPKAERRFVDWFYSRGQQRRLASNRVGRGVLRSIDQYGRWIYPRDMKREREELASAAPYEGRHRYRKGERRAHTG